MNITTSVRALALVTLPLLAFVRCGGEQKVAEAPTDMPSAEPPSDQAPELDAGTAAQTPAGSDHAASSRS